MNSLIRKILKTLLLKQPLNYFALHTIKALIALHAPFPFKRMVHRFPLQKSLVPFEVNITKDVTLRFANLGSSTIENCLYFLGIKGHEPEMLPIIFTLAHRINCFIDIGANNGHYSLIILALNRNCKVFAFEPSPMNIKWYLRNIEINKLIDNCRLIPKAVSDSTGKIKLYNIYSDTSSTIVKIGTDNEDFIEVDTITLDRFVEEEKLYIIDVIKIDVELAEPLVLEGMRNCLKYQNPIVICEILWSADVEKIRNIFSEYRYNAYHIGHGGQLKLNNKLDRSGTRDMRNFLFTKNNLADIGLSQFEVK